MSLKNLGLFVFLLSLSIPIMCGDIIRDKDKISPVKIAKLIIRPSLVSFALTWAGKYAYKKTDITNPLTKKIGFSLLLAPAALLYLYKYSKEIDENKQNARNYISNLMSNGLEFTIGVGAGLLVPTPN